MSATPTKKHLTIELKDENQYERTTVGRTGQQHHDRTTKRGDYHYGHNERRQYHTTIERIVRENSAANRQ